MDGTALCMSNIFKINYMNNRTHCVIADSWGDEPDFWTGVLWLAKNPKHPPGSAPLALDPRCQPPWLTFL